MFLIIISLVFGAIYATPLNCNYINMGFNLIQPVNECVIGKTKADSLYSMAHFCVGGNKVESRVWSESNDCQGDNYQITNTFDCSSNSTFVKCNCRSEPKQVCTTVIDKQFKKKEDGGCDTKQVTEFRQYIINEDQQCPDSFIDSNCFERSCQNNNNGAPGFATVGYWMDKLSVFKKGTNA